MSEQLLKFIVCPHRMSVQKVNVVAGLRCQELQKKITKLHNGFCLVGKALVVDSRSTLVAYLKCHYFLNLETLSNDNRYLHRPQAGIPGG